MPYCCHVAVLHQPPTYSVLPATGAEGRKIADECGHWSGHDVHILSGRLDGTRPLPSAIRRLEFLVYNNERWHTKQ